MDQDLIQIDDDLPHSSVAFSSTSIQNLQRRRQVRNQILAKANNTNGTIEHHVIFDDDEDDTDTDTDDETRKRNAARIRQLRSSPNDDVQLINLEETMPLPANEHLSHNESHTNGSVQNNTYPPLEDLTNEWQTAITKPIMQAREILSRSKHGNNISTMFEQKQMPRSKNDPISPNHIQHSRGIDALPLSPPRPFQQPVKHAKRAVSTLFGSSIVVNHSSDEKNQGRHISLLDAVSRPLQGKCLASGEHNSPDVGGMEMQNKRMSRNMINASLDQQLDGDDLIDFNEAIPKMNDIGASNLTESTFPRHTERQQQHQHQDIQTQDQSQIGIDIGDPFNYTSHSTMNHRNIPAAKQRLRNHNNSNNTNASSAANSWFGQSLNYTTQTMKMPQPTRKNPDRSMQDHNLLDKLQQDGAERFPDHQFSFMGVNRLNLALFISYGFTSAASSVPIALIPTIAMDVLSYDNEDGDDGQSLEATASIFASTVATYAVLGTAFGKFLNGPLGDICGARRVACLYALMLSISLMILSFGYSSVAIIACCAAVEFFQSVQWPCIAVILAAHYGTPSNDEISNESKHASRNKATGRYEKGIYIASLGSRCGSLFASLSTSLLLGYAQDSWRVVARLAAFSSFFGCLVLFMFVTDSPYKVHHPQNPVKEHHLEPSRSRLAQQRLGRREVTTFHDIVETIKFYLRMVVIIVTRNVYPSLRSVLSNGTFWIVAIAHSGGLMVCSSVRILGTYFRDTSYGAISESDSGAVTMFLSIGVLVGLAFGGNAFAKLSTNGQARKKMISNLYIMTVMMCYTLSFLAVPLVRKALYSSTIVAFFQAAASFCMGAGVAVQVYCIPAIVGYTFGANRGLYASYTDGVACIVSSCVWRIVGNAVEEGNPQGAGWFYGWAAVALLVVLAGLLMVQFVDYYFCREGWKGRLSDTNSKSHTKEDATTSDTDLNSSFAEIWEKRPAFFRPGSPFKRGKEMRSMLSIADDDDDDASTIVFEDVTLPIDYDDIETNQLTVDTKQLVLDLIDLRGNDTCVDCQAYFPRWVSILVPNRIALSHRGASKPLSNQIGCFCCTECAGSHRKLGNHISSVRSVDYDNFKRTELLALRRGGNAKVNSIYEALLKDISAKPVSSASMTIRERFIISKYEKKLWFNYSGISPPSPTEDTSFDHNTTMTSIELVPNHYEPKTAHFDRNTHDQYNAFVQSGNDSDSESGYSSHRRQNRKILVEDASISSEDSGDWHIEKSERAGLDELINL